MAKYHFCQICLDNNVRMHPISGSEVQDVYEKLSNKKIQAEGRLYFACYICYCQLKKSQELVIKSQKSEDLLRQISLMNSEMNLKSLRETYGLVNSLVVANIDSTQTIDMEYNEITIKMENLTETRTYEVMIKYEPDDDSAPPIDDPRLDVKHTFEQDEANSKEGKQENISETQTNTVANENNLSQTVCDGERKRVLGKNDKKSFICNSCGKTCGTKALLIKHISGHKPVIIKRNKTYIKTQKSKSKGKSMVTECDDLKNNFTDEKPFKCQHCDYASKYSSYLKEHIKIHTGEKPFKCQYCNYAGARKNDLRRHIRSHTGDKPFKCEYCNYTSSDNSDLKRHVRIHTGEKPFKCEYCDYSCTEKGNLKTHIRIHTGEKPYKCQYCDYSCTTNGALKKHIRMHTGEKPSQCQYCTYTCARSDVLKTHIRTHTGEKPFKCQYCDYSTAGSSHLRRHIRIHTGEKPYQCNICEKKFSVSSYLKSHLRVHR